MGDGGGGKVERLGVGRCGPNEAAEEEGKKFYLAIHCRKKNVTSDELQTDGVERGGRRGEERSQRISDRVGHVFSSPFLCVQKRKDKKLLHCDDLGFEVGVSFRDRLKVLGVGYVH